MDAVLELLLPFMAKYPVVSSVLLVIGGLRVLLKPVMAVLEAYVGYTPDLKDDGMLASLKESSIYKGIVFFLDYVASIKLPK